MRLRIHFALLLAMAAVSPTQAKAQDQTAGAKAKFDAPYRYELALDYTYAHSNTPPGGCGCINLNGGGSSFAFPLEGKLDFAGDIAVEHAGGIRTQGYTLTIGSYTAGLRYRVRQRDRALQPFAEALLGIAHAGGTLVQGTTPAVTNAGASFAANLGGGLDLRVNPRFSLRLIEAEYLLTTFTNGSNDLQNNLRINAGVVVRFGK